MLKQAGVVFQLAVSDLIHEWILSLCQVLAITAVLTPLLIIFGLKHGLVFTYRDYMMQDPRYREIRPLTSKMFEKSWFDSLAKRKDIQFLIPMTRQISTTVNAKLQNKDFYTKLNLVPTAPGDSLLLENGSTIPLTGEAVLSQSAANNLQAAVGDILEITTTRSKGRVLESGHLSLTVAGILSERATELENLYVPLELLEMVEKYKDGQAVPELGWPGSTPLAYPVFDGLIVLMEESLNQVDQFRLCNKTGFTTIEPVNHNKLVELAGYRIEEKMVIYFLSTTASSVNYNAIDSVRQRLQGKNAILIPWVRPMTAALISPATNQEIARVEFMGLSLSNDTASRIGLNPLPIWPHFLENNHSKLLHVMLPEDMNQLGKTLIFQCTVEGRSLSFPVSVEFISNLPKPIALVPADLMGIINLFRHRSLLFDKEKEEFQLFRQGYAGFRLIAASIDDVEGIWRDLKNQDIISHTEIVTIQKVKDLDRGLSLVYYVLSVVGLVGSLASLLAGLYAGVERKRKDIGVLRLMGVSGVSLFSFPVFQAVIIGLNAGILALLLFSGISGMVDHWLGPYLNHLMGISIGKDAHFCYLPIPYGITLLVGCIVFPAIAAISAAIRIFHIEPGEVLRDE